MKTLVCVSWLVIFAVACSCTAMSQSQYKVIYSFGASSQDGSFPNGGLVFDHAGNLYGTTQFGGAGVGCQFCGTVFELTPAQGGAD